MVVIGESLIKLKLAEGLSAEQIAEIPKLVDWYEGDVCNLLNVISSIEEELKHKDEPEPIQPIQLIQEQPKQQPILNLPTIKTKPIPPIEFDNKKDAIKYNSNKILYSFRLSRKLLDYINTKEQPAKFVRHLISLEHRREYHQQECDADMEEED